MDKRNRKNICFTFSADDENELYKELKELLDNVKKDFTKKMLVKYLTYVLKNRKEIIKEKNLNDLLLS